jgi:hypothetical protein
MTNEQQETILALLEWSAQTGRDLPLPAATIAGLEADGHVVDLVTGEVSYGGAAERVELTPLGEATHVVLQWETEA